MGDCASCFSAEDEETGQIRPLIGSSGPAFERVAHKKGAPTDKKWYHANISNDEAERRLRSAGRGIDGAYLVYDNPRKSGEYVLIVLKSNRVYRWKICQRKSDKQYVLGDDVPGSEGYTTVRELIKAHRGVTGKPIKTDGGLSITLNRSYVYIDN